MYLHCLWRSRNQNQQTQLLQIWGKEAHASSLFFGPFQIRLPQLNQGEKEKYMRTLL